VSRKEDAAIRLLARRNNRPITVLGKIAVREFLEKQRVLNTQSLGVEHLKALSNLTKQFILTAQLSRQPSKVPMKAEKNPRLPSVEKREDLELLTWKAVQAAVDYSKTEAAAKDAEARLLALRVANGLMRTELLILKHTDDAYVDALLKELGVDADGLERKTQKGS
jgi:hypothetical protein